MRLLVGFCLVWFAAAAQGVAQVRELRGRVLDQDDEPIPGVYVCAYQSVPAGEPGTAFGPPVNRPHPEREGVTLVRRSATLSDEQGRFEIRTAGARGGLDEWYLEFSESDHVPLHAVRAGADPLEVRMQRTGLVMGSLRVDEPVEPERISVAIGGETGSVGPHGEFEITGIPPGVHTLRVLLGFDTEPVVEIEGLEVTAGEACADRRLEAIDLRGKASVLVLDVVDEGGRPVNGFQVAPLDAPEAAAWFSFHSTLAVPTRDAVLDVAVSGFPSRLQRLRGVIGYQRVVLREPPVIELALAGGSRIPELPFVLMPYVEPVEPLDLPDMRRLLEGSIQRTPVGERRRAVAQVPDFGFYRVGWMLLRDERIPGDREAVISPLVTVRVCDSARPQVFAVPLDPAALTLALRREGGS